jgi:hypothetical protein
MYESISKALEDGVYFEMGGEELNGKIKAHLEKINGVLTHKLLPTKFVLEDPAGNSFVENPFAPNSDPYCHIKYFRRSKQDLITMGYMAEENNDDERKDLNEDELKISSIEEVQETNDTVQGLGNSGIKPSNEKKTKTANISTSFPSSNKEFSIKILFNLRCI